MTTSAASLPSLGDRLDLTGRVALVTGAGQGVGEATAAMLASQGAAVAVNDYFSERGERVADTITAAGGRAYPIQADVTDHEQVIEMAAAIAIRPSRLRV
jgi:3-oxoacyl-[acyl-carrier protein] reductase